MSGRGAERVLDAVEWFATTTSPVSFTDFVRALGVPKSSGLLLLQLLVKRNYIARLPDNRYRLLRLPGERAEGGVSWGALLRLADGPLHDAVAHVGESGFVAVLDGDRIRYLNKVLPAREIRYDRDIGPTRMPHLVASGLVFLAGYDSSTLERYCVAENLDIDTRLRLERSIESVRSEGTAINLEGVVEGASGVAAPVRDGAGQVIAAINISGPRERITAHLDAVRAAVLDVANAVTAEIVQRARKSA